MEAGEGGAGGSEDGDEEEDRGTTARKRMRDGKSDWWM